MQVLTDSAQSPSRDQKTIAELEQKLGETAAELASAELAVKQTETGQTTLRGATGRVRWCSASAPCKVKNIKGLLATRHAARLARPRDGHDPREESGPAFKVANYRFRTYPAHPSLIRSFAHQNADWSMEKRGGDFSPTIDWFVAAR